jgi:hypothetical protein
MAKQITELPDDLKREFKLKCFKIDQPQRVVIIELINMWLRDKVSIPEQG